MINVNKASDLTLEQLQQIHQEAVSKVASVYDSTTEFNINEQFVNVIANQIDSGNLEDARATVNGYELWLIRKGILPKAFVVDGVSKVWWNKDKLRGYLEYSNGVLHGVVKYWYNSARESIYSSEVYENGVAVQKKSRGY